MGNSVQHTSHVTMTCCGGRALSSSELFAALLLLPNTNSEKTCRSTACSRGRATGCSASKTAPPGAQDLRSRRPRQPQAQPHGTQLPHPQQSLAHCAARAVDTTRPDGLRYPPSKITLCIEIPVSVPILRPTSYPKRYPVQARSVKSQPP